MTVSMSYDQSNQLESTPGDESLSIRSVLRSSLRYTSDDERAFLLRSDVVAESDILARSDDLSLK